MRFTLLLVLSLAGCGFSAGTHGSIKSYHYSVTKPALQKAVQRVITTNPNIQLDSAKAWYDSTENDYYNDGDRYVTIKITTNKLSNEYTFRYAGDKEYWDTSKTSQVFIAYAFDKDQNGGSQGNGGVSWYKFRLRKRLIGLFESELVNKVDSILMQKHISTD
jgi:hypothetical protein